MAAIRSFRDLDVYKLGRERAKKVFAITKAFLNRMIERADDFCRSARK